MANRFECDIPNMAEKLIVLDELLVTRLGYSIEGEAKQNAPVDTGAYRNNINTHIHKRNAEVVAEADYSAAIEYGITPNDKQVFPKVAKALHFKINGKDVFAKWVRPFKKGRKPNPIMRNAARMVMKRDFNGIFNEVWKGIMK